jgi:hypothetical protein
MEINPYEYDRTVPWIPQQNQAFASRDIAARPGQQPSQLQNARPQQKGGVQKPRQPERMSKVRALSLARAFKKWLVVASIVTFGSFSGLVAYHQVSTTAVSNTSSGSSQSTSASGSSTTSSSSSASSSSSNSSSNGYFNQQGSSNFGSSSSSNSSVSGSSVS